MIANRFNSKEFEDLHHYSGELGAIYSKESTKFVIWAPTAKDVRLELYGTSSMDFQGAATKVSNMNKSENGIWTIEIDGDLHGEFYNYLVNVSDKINVVVDPYAKAVGVNGNRGMVVDLSRTNPSGFENDIKPAFKNATDAIIYEMHIRDFSIDDNSGVDEKNKGKFTGICVEGTTIPGKDTKTTLDHIKDLGITHVHLLPAFDYGSVDETKLDIPQYNWGYDPKNYNVPEGSYSTNPYNGETRIREFKEMVQKMHNEGIRVVMDVVYNHTYNLNSNLNLAVPGYYYRQDENDNYSDASACGNETASDRSMFRKFMVDSIVYWAKEYHIDGFRFDLMGIHDIETMKEIRRAVDKIDPSIILYGEGWMGGPSPLKDEDAALKVNTYKYDDMQIAAFSDDARDCVKGHVFYDDVPGFVNGGEGLEEAIKYTVVASTKHEQVDVNKAFYSRTFWANEPYQTVTYSSAHDNYTLWDKLQIMEPEATDEELNIKNKLIAALMLTSQGISFIHAGEEIARTKIDENNELVENSYCSPDSVNKIEWTRKEQYKDLYEYYKGLIAIRKEYKALRMNSNEEIQRNIKFLEKGKNFKDDNVIAYVIDCEEYKDSINKIAIIINGNKEAVEVNLTEDNWTVIGNENTAGLNKITSIDNNSVIVAKESVYILVK